MNIMFDEQQAMTMALNISGMTCTERRCSAIMWV